MVAARQQRPFAGPVTISMPEVPAMVLGLDEATIALERLVEETHASLVWEGLMHEVPAACIPSPGAPSAAIPSLDAVDQALEELQRGLVEIDEALARPTLASGADAGVLQAS
jgi:hypothetical protein